MVCPAEFLREHVQSFKLDVKDDEDGVQNGNRLSLWPFPARAGGPDRRDKRKAGPSDFPRCQGRTSTMRPWRNGSNNLDGKASARRLDAFHLCCVKGWADLTGDTLHAGAMRSENPHGLEWLQRDRLQPSCGRICTWNGAAEHTTHWILGDCEGLNEAMKLRSRNDRCFGNENGSHVPREAYALTPSSGTARSLRLWRISAKAGSEMVPKPSSSKNHCSLGDVTAGICERLWR